MKRFFYFLLWLLSVAIVLLVLGFGYVWINEWKPAGREIVFQGTGIAVLPDTITILTWNTGYAGLGADMDFFMDGGMHTRTSQEQTRENLRGIAEFLSSCKADIILLQEVDRKSHRSYGIDQFALYRNILTDYHGYFAYNYKTPFVPVPVCDPLGRVESGVAVFSKILPEQVVRYQYDSRFPFPVRLFNLKRCWLAAEFHTLDGRQAWIGVTHNTAYDTGNMRTIEMNQLYDWLKEQNNTVIGGDWNQNPPGYTPSPAEMENSYFSPQQIENNAFFDYFYDESVPSVRYLYEPLKPTTTVSVIDFYLASGDFRCLDIKTIDLGFRNSDHNPVLATFEIIPREPLIGLK